MKNTLFFLFISALLTVNAQTVKIEWEGAKDYKINFEKSIKLPFYKNQGYGVKNNVPQFLYVEAVPGMGKVTLENIQYTPLTPAEKGDLNLNEIPSQLQYTARISRGGDEYYLAVNMVPFIREGNQVRKVISFQIINQQGLPPDMGEDETYDPATQSVLRSGNWYKIKINRSGVFRLDKSFFDQNGIPTNFDPRTLKIYGNGGRMLNENPGDFRYGALQQNAIQFSGEADGSFDNGDYILFYGQGPHGWNRKPGISLESLTHRFNVYSDEAYYFITFGGLNGKRVLDMDVSGNPEQTFTQYHDYVFHEKDSINLNQIGRQWGGEMFNLEPAQTFTLTGGGSATGTVIAKYRMVGKDAVNATFNVSLNGNPIDNGTFGMGTFNPFPPDSDYFPVTTTGNTFTFTINVGDSSNPAAIVVLDYLAVKYVAALNFNGSQMQFRRLEDLNDGNVYGFALSGAQRVWNISDHTTAMNVLSSGGIYKYMSTSPHFQNEFIAFNESAAFTDVAYVGQVANQNLRALTDVDYAIVVHPDFISEAARLANFRQLNDGVKVAVVTTEQVYNEFSSGAQDISAIRDFFKHLRDNGNPLKYALLFGGASYDFKNRIPNNTHYVPAYQSFESKPLGEDGTFTYVTDDFFAMLDYTDIVMEPDNYLEYGAGLSPQMDIAIGRFPAHSLAEAKMMVDKTLAYYEKLPNQGTSFGDWKTKFYLVVDDDDPGVGNSVFHNLVESTSGDFIQTNISYAMLRKLYLDGFLAEGTSGGQRYPQVNQGITNAFDLGSALIVYFGHGGPRSWAQERVVTFEEINNFSNFSGLYSRLPVVLTITCDFTVWDLPEIASAGEFMYKNPVGGAVAMLTTSRPIGVSYGLSFNDIIVKHLLYLENGQYLPLGEALRRAKIVHAHSSIDSYSVNLLGDPMLSISRPPRQIRITKINGEDAATFDGVLRALDFVEIEGEVLNANGTVRDNSFNGKASATLFDKPINKTTFNNDGDMDILQYQEQINAIFRGGTNVTNGHFKFQFYVPKDINYEIGNGKLTVYAHNNVIDGVTSRPVKVGGQNPNGLDDDDGPAIGLYMNNLNFVDGGITDRDPYLLACLVDSTGINTSGIAIGHDITGVLDGNVEGTYVLNEYYEGGDNNPCTNPQVLDYQKGQVMYKLSRLELGNHQIVFKAWDINNNSSEQTLDFVVMEDGSDHIYIDKLLNWPNPFTNQTYFHFEHNCDTELDVMVQIFTISGKLVKTIRQPVSAEPWREGYRTGRFAIPWDGLDDFGDKIGKGVYIYRVTARGVDSELCKGSATAIEKLVILK